MDHLPLKDAWALVSRVAFVAWHIWKARNEFVFRGVAVKPLDGNNGKSMTEFCSSFLTPQVHMDNHPVGETPSWKALDCRTLKANCDVALKTNSSAGKIAVVLRDWEGR